MKSKVFSINEIDQKLIVSWKTKKIEEILNSSDYENELLLAYENGLFNTPCDPKITPRELIYVLNSQKKFNTSFYVEVKKLTNDWEKSSNIQYFNEHVPPLYSEEIKFILKVLNKY